MGDARQPTLVFDAEYGGVAEFVCESSLTGWNLLFAAVWAPY
ncbi:MAG: hypothetical protein AAGB00_12640 [Planctomycetota bacterium]